MKITTILFDIIYLITFAAATIFVTETYMISENLKEVLFGAMLLLVFVSNVCNLKLFKAQESHE